MDALDLADEHARTERDIWIRVAAQHRSIAGQLRATAESMAEQRSLPRARHDADAMSSPRVVTAFQRFLAAEEAVAALLAEGIEHDQAMLRQTRRGADPKP